MDNIINNEVKTSKKRIVGAAMVVALLALLAPLSAKTASPNQIRAPLYSDFDLQRLSDLSKTYGYYNGQRLNIERIQKDFPALAAEATKAQMKFDLVFKYSYENIEKMLREMLGDKWDEYQIQMQEKAEKVLSDFSISAEQAVAFIKQVALRAKGDIESPVLETLLTYNPEFQKNPAKEFLRGFTHTFRTKHHPKAKGVDFQIQYPKSWLAKEGKRPNVIQLFTSENGRGLDSIGLMVKDFPQPANSDEELTDLFSAESLREMLPDKASFISAKPVVLDRQKGVMLIIEQVGQRLDITMKVRSLQFITIYNNKMIFVQCGVVTTDENANSLNERFKKMEPLFKLVGNSFVIQSQYYDGSSSELQASVNDGDIVSRESDISERRKTISKKARWVYLPSFSRKGGAPFLW